MRHERIIDCIDSLSEKINRLEFIIEEMEGVEPTPLEEGERKFLSLSEFMDGKAAGMIHSQEERISAITAKLREMFVDDVVKQEVKTRG